MSLPVQADKSAAQDSAAHQPSQAGGRNKGHGKNASSNRAPRSAKGAPNPKDPKLPEKKEPKVNVQLVNCQVLSTLPQSCVVYVYPPLDLYYINVPDIVSEQPVIRSYDTCYRYSYAVGVEYGVPAVSVSRTTLVRGRPTAVIEGFVESELWLKFFNQSTIREYSTLIDSVAMLVIRGYTGKLLSHDANLKAEAMTAAYKLRYPLLRKPVHRFINSLATVRPLAPGYYALGGVEGPDMGPGDALVTFKTERSLREQHYRLKCLCDEFALIIPPYYAPALTPNEILKAARKRLQNPGREDATFNGVLYDENQCRMLLRKTVRRCLRLDAARWQSVELYDRETILRECHKHACEKWGADASEVEIYMRGAHVAVDSDVDSPEFQMLIRTAAIVKSMEKNEVYAEPKVARFIMIPSVMMRGMTHALLMNAQRRLFGSGELKNKHSVKHMSESERASLLKDLFGTVPVANGDITSMEATVTAFHMENIELPYFTTLCAPCEADKIRALWQVYITGIKDNDMDEEGFYHVFGKDYTIKMAPMRLSGCEHTSAGNFVVNHTWIHSIIRMITGFYPDWDKFKLVVEGDDSLYLADVPLENGEVYHIDPEEFKRAARALGTSQKLVTYPSYTQASFCGVNLKPVTNPVKGDQDDMIQWDTMWMLSKLLWTADYDPTTNKHNGELIYARALSFLPRAIGNPEAYDALMYLAQRFEPKENVIKSAHFRHIVFRTFFRGDFDEIPVLTSLEKYCQRNNYPFKVITSVPEILSQQQMAPTNMQVVKVDPVPQQSLIDIARNMFVSTAEPSPFSVEENQGRCAFYALWCYLRDHNDERRDFDTWYKPRAVEPSRGWRTLWKICDGLTMFDFMQARNLFVPNHPAFFGKAMPTEVPVPVEYHTPKLSTCVNFTITRHAVALNRDKPDAPELNNEKEILKLYDQYGVEYLNHVKGTKYTIKRLTDEEIQEMDHVYISNNYIGGHAQYKSLKRPGPVPIAMNNGEGDADSLPWFVKFLAMALGGMILFLMCWNMLNSLISIRGIPVTVAGKLVELFGSWGGLDLSGAGRTVNVIGVILVLIYKFKVVLKLVGTAGVLIVWAKKSPHSFNTCMEVLWQFTKWIGLLIAYGPGLLFNQRESRITHLWRLFWSMAIPLWLVWQLLRL